MSTTTMHFGPEWMRTKHQPLPRSSQQPPSPPPLSATSTYSALLSPAAPPAPPDVSDEAHPFRYSKDELLRIYKEGGGKGGLGLEVERWEGVVREIGSDPVGVRELSEAEKKLFSGPLNSDLRRRQSTDYLSPLNTNSLGTERPRLNHAASSNAGSPLRERFGALKRRESSDAPATGPLRKHSLSNLQVPLMSPRDNGLPSPRTRVGYTPGFDGVLNTGDSWSSRRRASETAAKQMGSASVRDVAENYVDEKVAGILEEKEDDSSGHSSQHLMSLAQKTVTNDGQQSLADGKGGHDPNNVTAGLSNLSILSEPVSLASSQPDSPHSTGPPPGFQDLGAVEWSYKDPSGQVQGPFRADIMQKWYDDGYFTPDLPMKRTHLDTQWMTVEELVHRAGGDRTFLSPIVPIMPPGLARQNQNGSPLQTFGSSDQSVFGDPYQPAPIRNLRSSTLDSYLSNGSNHSEPSPSSLGTGRFGESPDSTGYNGRVGANSSSYFTQDPSSIGRFTPGLDVVSPFGPRRGVFGDHPLDMRTNSYGNVASGSPMDVYSYTNQHSSSTVPWNQPQQLTPVFDQSDAISYSAFATGSAIPTTAINETYSNNRNEGDVAGNGFPATMHYNGAGSMLNQNASPYTNFGSIDRGIIQQEYSPVLPMPSQQYNPSGSPFIPQAGSHNTASLSTSSPTSWATTVEPQIRRPGPFESGHPTATNTTIIPTTTVPSSQSSPWNCTPQSPRPVVQSKESSPWVPSSQGLPGEAWMEHKGGDSDMMAPSTQTALEEEITSSTSSASLGTVELEQVAETASGPVPEPVRAKPEKSKSKPTQVLSEDVDLKATLESHSVVEGATPSTPAQKAPWAKEDDLKKVTGNTISLREIQEAEAKKAEAKKAAERERERLSRVAAAESKEDIHLFTASWGLPTSQAGVRTATTPKEASPSAPQPTVTPVWTNALKAPVAKKTMKEIQEEEERRKKVAAKETVATAAARRAYAESTNKVAPSSPSVGGVWTTVGPNGKSSLMAAATLPPRPAAIPTPSAGSSANKTTVAATTRPILTAQKPQAATTKPEEQASSPSHDFLKWLSETLKGLNSSVNVEEIMSMLLSFPLDPDASTLELISDLIYANSTTLDGRRFASEFVNKRKADSTTRAKGVGATGKIPSKPVSIADVVKAAPKAPQSDWGFKVVNKKKKGNRA